MRVARSKRNTRAGCAWMTDDAFSLASPRGSPGVGVSQADGLDTPAGWKASDSVNAADGLGVCQDKVGVLLSAITLPGEGWHQVGFEGAPVSCNKEPADGFCQAIVAG